MTTIETARISVPFAETKAFMSQPSPSADFARSEEVDSGEYFARGRNWAWMMFDMAIVERSYSLLALVILLMTLLLAMMVDSSLSPLSRPVRMAFENPNSGLEYPRMVPLSPDRAPLQVSLARYLAQQYVINREAYRYDRDAIDSQYRFVYNYSAPEIFTAYRTQLDPTNPESPLVRFERHTSRQIRYPDARVSITSTDKGIVRGTAKISYFEQITGTNGTKQARKEASLEFIMAEISVHKEDNRVYQYNGTTGKPEILSGALSFRVLRYQPPTETQQP